MREEENSIAMDFMQEKWVYYEELIEIIALITQEAFDSIVLE